LALALAFFSGLGHKSGDLLFNVLPATFGAFGLLGIMVLETQDDRKGFIALLAQVFVGGHGQTSFYIPYF
jgi:hypothetical protein